jgi:hypothetical protein
VRIAHAKAAKTNCAIGDDARRRRGGQEIPNHNIQAAPGKLQYLNPKVRVALGLNIEFWSLKIPWDLELGIWDFELLTPRFINVPFRKSLLR